MEFTIYQVIAYLSKIENKDKVFSRVNDEKFKVWRGAYGDIMMELNDIIRPLPIFNYTHDKFILEDTNNE